jgi:hypothetical protein
MAEVTVSLDPRAAAQMARGACDSAAADGVSDAEFNRFDRIATAKYSLKRVRAAQLISEQEEQQLDALIGSIAEGADPFAASRKIVENPDAAPVAVALADLAATFAGEHIATFSGAVIGAMAGQDLGSSLEGPPGPLHQLLSLAAAAGAAAVAAVESRRPKDANAK